MAKTRPSVLNLALNILGYKLQDKPVMIFGEDGNEVLADVAIISCRVSDQSKLMEHPIESGAKISDHKVFEPRSMDITIALTSDGFDTEYAELFDLYRQCAVLSLQTKVQVYNNLQIASIPHEEKVTTMNRLQFNIQLKEAIVVTAQFIKGVVIKPKKAPDKPTEEVGQQPPQKNESGLYGALNGKEGIERIRQAKEEGGWTAAGEQAWEELWNNNVQRNTTRISTEVSQAMDNPGGVNG